MDKVQSEEIQKVMFYEKVYIPYLRDTFDDFLDELGRSPDLADERYNKKALELLSNMAILLREPNLINSRSYGEMN